MLLTFILCAAVFYLGVMAAMFLLQRKLMYHPVTAIEAPEFYSPTAKLIALTTQDKTAIEAWHVPPLDESLPLIVYFHGNAGHIGDRMAKLNHFVAKGFGLLAVSYRGYGKSKGLPSEPGLYDDAFTTVQNAMSSLQIPASRMILYGESLGTGIATQTAKTLADAGTPAKGLVLEAPYTSVAARSQELYPFIPARYLVRDKYDSITKIKDVKCPVLLFHGEKDVVIPVHHGHALLAAAADPKRGIFYPEVGHTDFDPETLANEVLAFAKG